MNMMIRQIKQKSRLLLTLLAVLLSVVSCTDEAMLSSGNQNLIDENGMVRITIHPDVPDWQVTRAVNAGGEGINTMWVLTFNESGNMISRVAAKATHENAGNVDADQKGNFTVQVPASTRIIHILGNVIMDSFSDRDHIGRHENEVIGNMISSSGALTFWGRYKFDNKEALLDFAKNGTTNSPVMLYRNQAIVRYHNESNNSLEITGMCICNRKAYGSVAPFDRENQEENAFDFQIGSREFVTRIPERYDVKQTNPDGVYTMSGIDGDPRYIFENENPDDDQLYMIFRIRKNDGEEKYYKVMLVNDDKTPYQVIRNHLYTVKFTDVNESYGVGTFEAAHNATPANNPLLVVRDEVPDISYGNRTLAIDGETTRLYQSAGEQKITYTYNGVQEPNVTWISNERVAEGNITHTWNSTTHEGTITIQTNAPGEEVRHGVLLVKEANGPMSRRIKVITAPKFDFGPVWISSEIPLLEDEAVTILFYVPDNYPDELLPSLDVKFACNLIDGKAGENFRIVDELTQYMIPVLKDFSSNTPEWVYESAEPDWNYKYVYDGARTKGQHRVNFRTLLTNIENSGSMNDERDFHIYMEDGNGYFNTRDLYFAFQHKGDDRRIMLDNGDKDNNYVTRTINNLNPVNGETVTIPFTLGTLEEENMEEEQTVDATIMVYYDPKVLKPIFTEEDAKQGLFGNYYVPFKTTNAKNQLTFETVSPNYDSYVVLSAKSVEHYNNKYDNTGTNTAENAFRSASVTLRSTGRLDFNPSLEQSSIAYGIGKTVKLSVNIPDGVGTHSYTIKLGTRYLEPVGGGWTKWPNSENEGYGYDYVIPEGHTARTETFEFKTTRIVSAETLTLSSSGNVAFNDTEVTFTNTVLTGKIQLPNGINFGLSPYVVLQRSDGTFIGSFGLNNVSSNTASYYLTLYGEYDLHPEDKISIFYSPVDSETVYINESEYKLNDLLNLDIIKMKERD